MARKPKEILRPRADIAALRAYDPEHHRVRVNLSANENPYDLPAELKAAILQVEQVPFNRYPDPGALELRRAIGSNYGLGIDGIAVGNGGDELILALLLAYGGAGRTVVSFEPTFVMYRILSTVTGTACVAIERGPDFGLPGGAADSVKAAAGDIVFICSPNNPTGNTVSNEALVAMLTDFSGLVVVDEAYQEFAGESAVSLLNDFPNLAVLRTFSKAFSLAGLRVGYLLADPEIIANILKAKLPYNVNALSQAAAAALMRRAGALGGVIEEIRGERDRVFEAIDKMPGLTAYPSEANFIFVRVAGDGPALWRDLLSEGILVRNLGQTEGLENCLRVTVGRPDENDVLIETLEKRGRGGDDQNR
jgi:histidinol-phosphate aminotransferase